MKRRRFDHHPGQPTVIRLLALLLAIGAATAAQAQLAFTPAPSFSGPHPAVVRIVVPERDGAAYAPARWWR